MSALTLPDAVRVVEVGLRDGLQVVPEPLPTPVKVEIVESLIACGVREIEAVSFAHPAVLPQLADAAEVMAAVPRPDGVRYRGLVPNLRGAQRAADCGLDEIVALTCCDDRVSRINQGRGAEEVLAEVPALAATARHSGADFVGAIAMSFFATGAGPTDPDVPVGIARRLVDAGASGVILADTAGMADPRQVADLIGRTREALPGTGIGVHLHTRNGLALANTLAALQAGVDWIESAFGGLGGDLWFPGDPDILGNTPTEDVLTLAESMGVATGIDLTRYLGVVDAVASHTGRPPVSHTVRGGTRAELAAVDWDDILRDSPHRTTTR